jgi:hypothetical protein
VTAAEAPLAPGARRIELDVERQPDGSGRVVLSVDGEVVGRGAVPRLLMMISSLGMDIGRSPRPVSAAYETPFAYPGRIGQVVFELPSAPPELARAADRSEVVAAMSRQ